MANLRLLDVAIGLLLMLLLISLLVTIVQEGIASIWKLRASNLSRAVINLLGKARAEELYKHPLIMALYQPKVPNGSLDQNMRSLPSYIPSSTFVIALLDIFNKGQEKTEIPGERVLAAAYPSATDLLQNARKIIETIKVDSDEKSKGSSSDESLKRALLLMIGQHAEPSPTAPQAGAASPAASSAAAEHKLPDPVAAAKAIAAPLEKWFDQSMDRAAGWYKRQAQLMSVVIGLLVAVAANADVVYVAGRLWNDASLRASVTAAAEAFHSDNAGGVAGTSTEPLSTQLSANLSTLQNSTLPIGWGRMPASKGEGCIAQLCPTGAADPKTILLMIAGWIVTALATSLGAPFWFDLLNKALQLRSSGGRVATANDRPSKK